LKIVRSRKLRLFGGLGRRTCTVDFGGEAPRHAVVALVFRELTALLKDCDGPLYLALAKQDPGLTENPGIAFTLLDGIHGC